MNSRVNIKSFLFNPFQENTYLLWNEEGDCVIVDPGCYTPREEAVLKDFIRSKNLKPVSIWLTHGHFDHIFGVGELTRCFSIPVWMAPEDKFILEKDGEYETHEE